MLYNIFRGKHASKGIGDFMLGELPEVPKQSWESMLGSMHALAKAQNKKLEKKEEEK